jgi:hypothetical protein
MKPQSKLIYDALKRGETLTPHSSLRLYGVHSLSQRIGNLKTDPLVVEEIVSVRVCGEVYHKYYIPRAVINAKPQRAKHTVSVAAHERKAGSRCERTLDLFGDV